MKRLLPLVIGILLATGGLVLTQGSGGLKAEAATPVVTEILGRPTHQAVVVNARADTDLELHFEYGRAAGEYQTRTDTVTAAANERRVVPLGGSSQYVSTLPGGDAQSAPRFLL